MSAVQAWAKSVGTPVRVRWRRVMPWLAATLLLLSLPLPYWKLTLYAPQYPGGLRAYVYLTHVGGDVEEITNLNHYIGMQGLDEAAPLERRLAVPLVLLSAAAAAGSGAIRKRRALLQLPLMVFPVGVVASLAYWLWRFGHSLDPSAPIRIAPFMPRLFGRGTVMQFGTVALPHVGFALAVAASALVLSGLIRKRETA